MKKHNELVRFKNSFISDPQQKETLSSIISDDLTEVVGHKLRALIELYRRSIAEEGYSEKIAYRVITICLVSKQKEELNLTEEISRFFKFCLARQSMQQIRLCSDLLLIPQIKEAVREQHFRLFKIRLLKALRQNYHRENKKEDRRKASYTLRTYCRQTLQKEYVKRDSQIYEEILDILIEEEKERQGRLVSRGNNIKAIQELTAFLGLLEMTEKIVSSKYQLQLMEAYCALAVLHDHLHYLAYTKKYALIALNIAERLAHSVAIKSLKFMIQSLPR